MFMCKVYEIVINNSIDTVINLITEGMLIVKLGVSEMK